MTTSPDDYLGGVGWWVVGSAGGGGDGDDERGDRHRVDVRRVAVGVADHDVAVRRGQPQRGRPGPEAVVAVGVLVRDGARGVGALLVDVGRAGDDVRVVGVPGELVGVRVGEPDVVVTRRGAGRTRDGDG